MEEKENQENIPAAIKTVTIPGVKRMQPQLKADPSYSPKIY